MIVIVADTIIVIGGWLPIVSAANGFVVPWLTELLTRQLASGLLRTAVLTLLAAVGGAVAIIISNGGSFALQATLIAMLTTWVTALATQAHFANPQTSTGPLLKLRVATAAFGLGAGPRVWSRVWSSGSGPGRFPPARGL